MPSEGAETLHLSFGGHFEPCGKPAPLRLRTEDAAQVQLSDPQLCIVFGQTVHIMRAPLRGLSLSSPSRAPLASQTEV